MIEHMAQDFLTDCEYYFIKYTFVLQDCCIYFGRYCFGSNYGMMVIMASHGKMYRWEKVRFKFDNASVRK